MQHQITFEWSSSDHTAIICNVTHWNSWQQIHQTMNAYDNLTSHLTYPVHLICVFHRVTVSQPDALLNLHKVMSRSKHPQQITVMVNAPHILRIFMRISQQVYGVWDRENEYVFVNTLSAALDFLSSYSLDEIKTPPLKLNSGVGIL